MIRPAALFPGHSHPDGDIDDHHDDDHDDDDDHLRGTTRPW